MGFKGIPQRLVQGLDDVPVEVSIHTMTCSSDTLVGSWMQNNFFTSAVSDPVQGLSQTVETGKQSVLRILADETTEFRVTQETVEKKLLRW